MSSQAEKDALIEKLRAEDERQNLIQKLKASPADLSDGYMAAMPSDPSALRKVEKDIARRQPYINEMHPDLKAKDRFFIKNLASNPSAVVGFLRKRYPEHEVKLDPNTNLVFIRNQDEVRRGVKPRLVEESGLPSTPSEALQDVSDVTYDIARGVGTTAASAAAALGTSAAVPGAGLALSLPAASAASGTTGAAFDATRQGLGKLVGIPQDFSATEALQAGATDAIGTLLFGAGVSPTQVKNMLVEKFGPEKAAEIVKRYGDTVLQSGRGIPGKVWDIVRNKFTPKVGETVSGVQADILRKARDNAAELAEWGARSKTEAYEGVVSSVKSNVDRMKQEIIDEEKIAYGSMAGSIPTKPIKDELLKYKDKLSTLYEETKSPLYKKQMDVVQDRIDAFFPKEEKIATGLVDANGRQITTSFGAPEEISIQAANDLKRRIQDDLGAFSTYNADRLKASGLSGTSVDNELAMVGKSISKKINELSDTATGGATAKVRKKWENHLGTVEDFNKKFGNPEDAEKTLLSLRGPKTAQLQEKVAAFDAKYGTNLMETAKTAQAERVVSNAPIFHQSASGVTSTLRGGAMAGLGAGVGYQLGQGLGDNQRGAGLVGASIGAPVALALTSPRAMMQYAKLGGLYSKLLSPSVGESIPQALTGLGQRKFMYDSLNPKDEQ